jgi:anti-sigma regulatory factor (Ser/Thr protein kinase)
MWSAVCRVAVREIAGSEQAPAGTRHWAADRLRHWDLEAEVDRTLLVLNELVTNAVVHSPGAGACRIVVHAGSLEVVVSDDGPGPSRRALRAVHGPDRDGWERAGGRGLRIVAAVADRWGATFLDGRSAVWARWALDPAWARTHTCACDGTDGELLGSGGRVRALPGAWDEEPDTPAPPMSPPRRPGRRG